MPTQQAVHDLMTQIGPVLDLAQVTEFPDDASWHLVFDADTYMDIEYEPSSERLMVTGDLLAEPQNREKVFEALLRYNYLWTTHGGVRAALDGIPGHLVLMLETPVSGLEISHLCAVLQNFHTEIKGWRAILNDSTNTNAADEQPVDWTGIIRC